MVRTFLRPPLSAFAQRNNRLLFHKKQRLPITKFQLPYIFGVSGGFSVPSYALCTKKYWLFVTNVVCLNIIFNCTIFSIFLNWRHWSTATKYRLTTFQSLSSLAYSMPCCRISLIVFKILRKLRKHWDSSPFLIWLTPKVLRCIFRWIW